MQKMKTIIVIWIMFIKDHKQIAQFPNCTPDFYLRKFSILLIIEFYSKTSSNYFYGGLRKGLFLFILEIKFLASILTLCFVTIFLSLNRSFFLYLFWLGKLWDLRWKGLFLKFATKSWLDSGKKLPGVTERSS